MLSEFMPDFVFLQLCFPNLILSPKAVAMAVCHAGKRYTICLYFFQCFCQHLRLVQLVVHRRGPLIIFPVFGISGAVGVCLLTPAYAM